MVFSSLKCISFVSDSVGVPVWCIVEMLSTCTKDIFLIAEWVQRRFVCFWWMHFDSLKAFVAVPQNGLTFWCKIRITEIKALQLMKMDWKVTSVSCTYSPCSNWFTFSSKVWRQITVVIHTKFHLLFSRMQYQYCSPAFLNRWAVAQWWAAKLLQVGREMFWDKAIITPSHEFWNKFFVKFLLKFLVKVLLISVIVIITFLFFNYLWSGPKIKVSAKSGSRHQKGWEALT